MCVAQAGSKKTAPRHGADSNDNSWKSQDESSDKNDTSVQWLQGLAVHPDHTSMIEAAEIVF